MKKIIFTTFISLGVSYAFAQKLKVSEVPISVKNGFEKHFPSAKIKAWEKEGINFEAEFDLSKVETSALFDATGNLLETESEITVSALPKAAIKYLSETLKGEKIKEAAKIIEANGKIKYEAEIKGKDYLFDSEGNFMK
jgi:hypothetical protein